MLISKNTYVLNIYRIDAFKYLKIEKNCQIYTFLDCIIMHCGIIMGEYYMS